MILSIRGHVSFALWIESRVCGELNQCRVCRNRCSYGRKCDRLSLCAEFRASLADRSLQLFLLFLQGRELLLIFSHRGVSWAVQGQFGQLCSCISQLIEQLLIL